MDDARWYRHGPPPRQANRVALLVDGCASMLEMYLAILDATDHVWLAAWALNPDMELVRGRDQARVPPVPGPHGQPSYRLRDLLAYKAPAVDVRVLLWQGLLLFRPRRHLVYRAQESLRAAHPDLRVVVDATEPFGHSHHQKFLVVDGRVAFVGGLDLTDFDADRWDTTRHAVRRGRNWHDVTCRLAGPCVEDLQRSFVDRWTAAARTPPPRPAAPPPAGGTTPVQVVRTIPARFYPYARGGEEGILHSCVELIARAQHFIYIENQYLWSPRIAESLIAAIERPRREPFQVALVLPVRPNIGKTDTDRNVRRLLAADRGRGRMRVYSLYTWGPIGPDGSLVYKPIYVHAKLIIVDDTWLTVGSANLNTRSLVTDTELNVLVHDAAVARHLRLSLWSEHLMRPLRDLAAQDPVEMLEQVWPRTARATARQLRHGRGALSSRLVPYPLGVVLSGIVTGKK